MKAAIARVLDDCAGLRAGEQVAIVSDTGFDPALVEAFAREVRARDAVVVSLLMEPPRLPGEEPPPIVAAAMRSANLVLELTSTFIGSSQARVLACQAGARYLALPAYNKEILRDGGPLSVDFAGIRPTVLRLAERWGAASEYRLTTPAGTDLRGSIRGRKGRALHGIAREPGSYMVPPDIEAGTAPVEGTSEGEAVIDGALLFMYDKPLETPVLVRVRNGRVTEIRGQEAWRLTQMIDRCNDPRMDNLAEVAIGLNPKATVNGIPLESEASLGTAHIALGNNVAYGGTVPAVAHLDLVMRDVTLELDGEVVIERGTIRRQETG